MYKKNDVKQDDPLRKIIFPSPSWLSPTTGGIEPDDNTRPYRTILVDCYLLDQDIRGTDFISNDLSKSDRGLTYLGRSHNFKIMEFLNFYFGRAVTALTHPPVTSSLSEVKRGLYR
ncbi:hypothetical protein TNIN_319121 [Trichonephila inaurata madagascariensis]|uniref:Uncharacterized protein n=1 Tax=Trichonephila inaurata madagascariensis TaxID=2747483 RepID=A0A8X6JD60_9ARAC|nr:hypothetical protein TNIN_319121 [Trichonephila inaurata madagascariensis]